MANEIRVAVPGSTGIQIFTDTVRIGRSATNGIVLHDEIVSAVHAELRQSDAGWEIVDLGSTNGTFLAGALVTTASLGAHSTVRLGPSGPELHLSIPALRKTGETKEVDHSALIDRYLAEETPEHMSPHTQQIRVALSERREQDAVSWLKRIRHLRVAVGLLVVLAIGAGGYAIWQAQRLRELRAVAGSVFNTMKSLDLDVRRLEANAAPDRLIAERRTRLEKQYNDMMKTLGIYSSSTPADVQLIYRTIHRLGESEATVPRGFVKETQKYIEKWKRGDLRVSLARANAEELGPRVAAILLKHHLPREFFYMALQESNFNTRAIGPSTRFGVPKGLWQLLPRTGEAYGLRLGPMQGERTFDPADERHDVAKSTAAAARYIEDIYTTDAQASGLLVMAAYNMGETRLLRMIRAMPESPSERNFWALLEQHRKDIPIETYDYVYRVVAAAVICANPKLFGFDFAAPLGASPDSTVTAAPR